MVLYSILLLLIINKQTRTENQITHALFVSWMIQHITIVYFPILCGAIWLHSQNKGTMGRECYQTAGEISSLDSFLIRRLSTILLKSAEGWKPHDFITPIQSWQSKCLVNCLFCQHRSWFTTSPYTALVLDPVCLHSVWGERVIGHLSSCHAHTAN